CASSPVATTGMTRERGWNTSPVPVNPSVEQRHPVLLGKHGHLAPDRVDPYRHFVVSHPTTFGKDAVGSFLNCIQSLARRSGAVVSSSRTPRSTLRAQKPDGGDESC